MSHPLMERTNVGPRSPKRAKHSEDNNDSTHTLESGCSQSSTEVCIGSLDVNIHHQLDSFIGICVGPNFPIASTSSALFALSRG
jgi:hypothetical protein